MTTQAGCWHEDCRRSTGWPSVCLHPNAVSPGVNLYITTCVHGVVVSPALVALGYEPPPIHVYPVGEGHEMSENCWCHPKVTTP